MQIDYTGQYAAKEIDQAVSLISHSARKSFAELRTFNYFFSQIVSLCLANALSNGAKPCCDAYFHDKLAVHEVPAFSGIISASSHRLTIA